MELHDQPLTTPEETAGDAFITPEENAETAETTTVAAAPMGKTEIVAALEKISQKDAAEITREEVNRLKVQFFAIRHDELAAEKAEFLAKGNEEAAFAALPDEHEDAFKAALNIIKEKKAELAAAQEAERLINLDKKNAVIDEIDAASEDTDNVHRHLDKVRELQQQFKAIGEVPAPEVSNLWKRYQTATEKFYDQLKVNKDLRDLDFRKNFESKLLICEESERLSEEPDVVVAFRRLQDLHDKWREIGPVAKEQREDIWNRFKDASAVINKKYQAFFEERKAAERANEEAKNALCEQIEAISLDELKSFAAWDEKTKAVLQAQEEWKKLGFASRKTNAALFTRFRSLCDNFFSSKATYFKSVKDDLSENLAKKLTLCEKAEELKDSTDWKKTTDKLIALQNEWKSIGAVPKKQSDAVWTRFRAACDYFFEQKKQTGSDTRRTEQANLKEKKAIIEQLRAITAEGAADIAAAKASVRELMGKYQQIGHVPFRDKDKLHDAYRAEVSRLYDELDMSTAKAGMAAFEASVDEMSGDSRELMRQRDKLMRSLEMKRSEIKTFENNLGFFNSRTKSGEAMLNDIQRRISRLRDDQTNIEKKIALIDSKLK
ncbi:MAG: DUF349 domain-containing protein [Muribaculaceae bacterium]|jgi:hypothetical protein|nr:DUF349 domain-containing protein [Muribaculaceae bacterium]